jgi:hypothetical protein
MNVYNSHGILKFHYFLKIITPEDIKIKIYRIIFLPVVWYGCDTRSFNLREESRLRVLEKSLLRRVFGPKRDEITRK